MDNKNSSNSNVAGVKSNNNNSNGTDNKSNGFITNKSSNNSNITGGLRAVGGVVARNLLHVGSRMNMVTLPGLKSARGSYDEALRSEELMMKKVCGMDV